MSSDDREYTCFHCGEYETVPNYFAHISYCESIYFHNPPVQLIILKDTIADTVMSNTCLNQIG